MDLWSSKAYTRRIFLQRGVTLASAAATIPWFLQSSAAALAQGAGGLSSVPGVPDDHLLVVIQLGGGNDGLNTVIPVGAGEYHRVRPVIGVPDAAALRLDGRQRVALHPALTGLKSLYEDGALAVVQGVGSPNPNRSHFKSMDIWHTADTTGTGKGWLGRYFDNECEGAPDPSIGVAIGRKAPLAMEGRAVKPVSFESPDLFQWTAARRQPDLAAEYDAMMRLAPEPGADTPAAFLMRTALDAQVSSDAIRRAVSAQPLNDYPRTGLARQLAMVGAMIRAGMKTRVYYVSMSGFDTHAGQGGQQGRHAQLLGEFAGALKAFYDDLKAQRSEGRVLTLCFSEFGRCVGQNASGGTDHGAAAPMFLAGPMVRPGVLSEHPSLTDLVENGDLKFSVDFRCVYAGVLKDWMGADADAALGRRIRPAQVVQATKYPRRACRPLDGGGAVS